MNLFTVDDLDLEDNRVLEEIHARRAELSDVLRTPRRWSGPLRRNLMAKAIQGSNSIEGYVVETDDAAAAIDHQEALSADDRTFAEIRGYRQTLGYALTMASGPSNSVTAETLKALHFMMLSHDLSKGPGQFRPGSVYVRDEKKDLTVYEGPDADDVPELVESLTASLMFGHDPLVVAAMAHLNLVMIHPFRDGNGRMARALQTLVLAKSGIGNPEFSSIEEWLGANTEDYYRALAHAGGGSWQPERSTSLWLKFNLRAHHIQSQTVERRIKRSELLWEKLDDMISTKKLPERVFDALYDAVDGFRIRRSTYMAQSKTDERTASRDLKRLVDTEVLEARGEKRGRIYVAGPMLIAMRQGVVTDLKYTIAEPYKGFAALLAGDVT